jgi:alpha-beta hydrolase superfamily lysophospholipase
MTKAEINLTPTAACFDIEEKLPARSWGNAVDCQAGILLVHGLGASSAWFEPLARRLKVRQMYVLSYDQVGFGKRRQEKFSSSKQWFEDLQIAFEFLTKQLSDKPAFIVGNSMGGLVALASADRVKPSGLAMLSPGFDGHPETFTFGYRLSTLVKALLNPEKDFDLPYGLDLVTEVESVRNWLENDPEKRFSVPGKMLLELLFLTQGLNFNSLKTNCPVLMMLAGRDRIVNNRVNRQFFKRIESPEKTEVCFENSMHDLTLNPIIDEVSERLYAWIQAHSPRRAVTS